MSQNSMTAKGKERADRRPPIKPETRAKIIKVLGEALLECGFPDEGQKIIEAAGKGKGEPNTTLSAILRSTMMNKFDEQLEKGVEPTPQELQEIFTSVKKIPYQLRATLSGVVKNMPHAPGGAPGKLTEKEKNEVCALVGTYMGQGLKFREALEKVAAQKKVSARTIQRAWQEKQRKQHAENSS